MLGFIVRLLEPEAGGNPPILLFPRTFVQSMDLNMDLC